MDQCPNCKEKNISLGTKIMAGPTRTILCTKCGALLTVPWYSMLLTLSMVVLIFWFSKALTIDMYMLSSMIVIGAYAFVKYKLVPLKIRKKH